MENIFSKKMKAKTLHELHAVVKQKERYDDNAVMAAIWEIEKRGESVIDMHEIKDKVSIKIEAEEEEERGKDMVTLPKFFIFVVSFLLTPLLGGILFSINLIEVKKKKAIGVVMGFAVIYTLISAYLYAIMNYYHGIIIIGNALGGVVIGEVFWNRYIRSNFPR